jgi:hypothetical protein
VLELSDRIVAENGLTALMITHNMRDAIAHGNRLIMMNEGRIILDIEGEEKKKLTKADLLQKFAEVAGVQEETDEVLLLPVPAAPAGCSLFRLCLWAASRSGCACGLREGGFCPFAAPAASAAGPFSPARTPRTAFPSAAPFSGASLFPAFLVGSG